MNDAKLDRLRAIYSGRDGFDILDPEFRKITEVFPTARDRLRWAFDEPATFFGLPYQREFEPGSLDVAVVGIPIDLGVTNRAGARFGPRAVRAAERIGPFDHVLRIAPARHLRIADVGDVPFSDRFDLSRCHEDIRQYFANLIEEGVVPLAVGGDHSVTFPILQAVGRQRPVGLVHLDAHCDTAGSFEGRWHHGSPFRQAVLDGVLDPERTVQIGIRGSDEFFWEFSYDSGMTVLHTEDVATLGVAEIVARARAVVGEGPVYVSVDVDCLDPAFAPGTGTPEAGGLTPRELLGILRGLKGLDVVGGDVMEVAPAYDPAGTTAQIAAQSLFTILCLVALRKAVESPPSR